jgi:pilus assembly protein CpaB
LLTEAMFARGVALQLMPGERAMAVPVDEVVGAGNRIVPGDHVDVFFTLKEGQDISKTQSRLLASRLRVLSYGAATVASDPSATADGNGGNGANTAAPAQRTVARTAVLAVPVEQVNRVVLATQSGKLLLALRNPSDETLPDLALFPEPGPALAGKAGLSREQQDLLSHPDNRAFAGIELTGLAGETGAPQRQASARTTKAPARSRQGSAPYTVEVIRGTQREAVAY